MQLPTETNQEKAPTYFEYKGNLYYSDYIEDALMDESLDTKHKHTRKVKTEDGWEDAVVYFPVEVFISEKNPENTHIKVYYRNSYIRSRRDFESKFGARLDIQDNY